MRASLIKRMYTGMGIHSGLSAVLLSPDAGGMWEPLEHIEGSYMALVLSSEKGSTVMDVSELIAERIRNLCKQKGYSYYRLEQRSGVPISSILRIVKGNTKDPRIKTILKICSGLDMEIKEFFDTEELFGCGYEID